MTSTAHAGADTPVAREAPAGLEGLVVAETNVGEVRGRQGFYHYRQYSAVDLAQSRTLEDVWHLLVHGELPAGEDRERFARHVGRQRAIPAGVAAALPLVVEASETPLDALRTALSLAASGLAHPVLDVSAAELRSQTVQLTAMIPTLIAQVHRLAAGLEPVAADPELTVAQDYLRMVTGEQPAPERARALEQYLITTIDHGFNASTFTARVIASTGADVGAAIVGALGALSGPLHGGAPSLALDLLDEIVHPDRAEEVVRGKIARGERIMGFGHRVYRTQDPRAVLLREVALGLGSPRARLAAQVEDTVVRVLAELKPERQLYANVEYYAGVVLADVGLPPQLFTPTFVASRCIGWSAHVLEQAASNRLIRPLARYVGPPPPVAVPPAD